MPKFNQTFTDEKKSQIAFCLLLMVVIFISSHLFLGSYPITVCIAVLTIFLGALPIFRFGLLNIGVLLILLVIFRYAGFPMIGKLVHLQPLGSNLFQPLGSFATVFLGVLSYLFGFIIIARLDFKRRILMPTTDPDHLLHISIVATVVGCLANLGAAYHSGTSYTGITFANFFVPFLHLALITAIAAETCKSDGQRSFNYWVLTIIFIEIAFAFVRNSRMALIEIVICYLLTIAAFQVKVHWRRVSLVGILTALLIFLITPVMLHVRSVRNVLSWSQMISATFKAASDWRAAYENLKMYQELQNREGFYLSYYGSPKNILERMSFINHVDVIKNATDKHDTIGSKDLSISFIRSFPRVVVPHKPVGYGHGDWVNCELNIGCHMGSFSTVPLIANGYAAFGWVGALFYPLLFGSGIFLLIRLISGFDLTFNVWGIYLFVRIQNSFIEGDTATCLQIFMRDIPQDVIVIFFVVLITNFSSYKFHNQRKTT